MRENIWLMLRVFFDPIDPSYIIEWRKEYPDVYDLLPKLGRIEKEYLVEFATLLGMIWSNDAKIDRRERQLIVDSLQVRRIMITIKRRRILNRLFKQRMDINDLKLFYKYINISVERLLQQIVSIENRINRDYGSRYLIFFNHVRNYCEDKLNAHVS